MTEVVLLRTDIRYERDVVLVRQRARQLAALIGFDQQDQTRLATSVSEIARNAFEYAGGGTAQFVSDQGRPPAFLIRVSDTGPGIAHLAAVLQGRYESPTGMGVGILGARRLVDRFHITSDPGGTVVTLGKAIPPGVPALTPARLAQFAEALQATAAADPVAELQSQNRELLRALDEIRARQAEIERLNGELAETNRGVLALYAELDDRAVQLARASDLKSRFLSNISHELRTPLNAVHNLTRILLDQLDGDLNPEQVHQVTMIRSAAQVLTEMVSDLLDLAKIEAGKTVLRIGSFSVAELLGATRGMLRPILVGDAVALLIDLPEGDWMMTSDQGRLSQILRNLVSNAVKFTERGEIRVTAALDPVDDVVEFRVADTGIGIAADDIERIFEEYAQVENTVQRNVTGTGLGLPLSRKLAELLGGTLEATSIRGAGSTFTLRVRRDLRTAALAAAEVPGEDDAAMEELRHV